MFLFWITITIITIIIVIAYRQEQHQQPWLLFLLGQAQKEVEVAGGGAGWRRCNEPRSRVQQMHVDWCACFASSKMHTICTMDNVHTTREALKTKKKKYRTVPFNFHSSIDRVIYAEEEYYNVFSKCIQLCTRSTRMERQRIRLRRGWWNFRRITLEQQSERWYFAHVLGIIYYLIKFSKARFLALNWTWSSWMVGRRRSNHE